MKIKPKLSLIIGTFIVIFILSSVASWMLVTRIDDDVKDLGLIQLPLEDAALDMAVSHNQAAAGVILYTLDLDAKHLQRVGSHYANFEASLEEFLRLSNDPLLTAAARHAQKIHVKAEELGTKLIENIDTQQTNFLELQRNVTEIHEIIVQNFQNNLDRNNLIGFSKIEIALELEIKIDEAFTSMLRYVIAPDPSLRQIVNKSETEFENFEKLFRSFELSSEESKWIDIIDEDFQIAVNFGNLVMNLADTKINLTRDIQNNLNEFEEIVVLEILPIVKANTKRALDDAQRSVNITSLEIIIFGTLGISVGIGLILIVTLQISNPIMILQNSVMAFGRGETGVRVNFKNGDEIGDLGFAFNQMAADRQSADETQVSLITALKKGEAEQRFQKEEMQALSSQLVTVQEQERRLLAKELHDEFGQILTGLNITLETFRDKAGEETSPLISQAQVLVIDLMSRVREMSLNLRPSHLDDLGIIPALRWHIKIYTASTGVKVDLQSDVSRRFAQDLETASFRIIQEGLTNVARHAGVKNAVVQVHADDERLIIKVQDKGSGFEIGGSQEFKIALGISGMRERAQSIGGNFNIESSPNTGTILIAEFPLNTVGPT